jgi:hypothetical protein
VGDAYFGRSVSFSNNGMVISVPHPATHGAVEEYGRSGQTTEWTYHATWTLDDPSLAVNDYGAVVAAGYTEFAVGVPMLGATGVGGAIFALPYGR